MSQLKQFIMPTLPNNKLLIPQHCPFRRNSLYSIIYSVLSAYPDGIARNKLIAIVSNHTTKPIQNIEWAVSIVCSVTQEGFGHRSVRSKADYYYIIKVYNNYRLVLRNSSPTQKTA